MRGQHANKKNINEYRTVLSYSYKFSPQTGKKNRQATSKFTDIIRLFFDKYGQLKID